MLLDHIQINHLRRLFAEGGIYFLTTNKGADGKLFFRHAVESNMILDDPAGAGRSRIQQAFAKAQLLLPENWQDKLNTAIEQATMNHEIAFADWLAEGKQTAVVKIKSISVKQLVTSIKAMKIPKDLNTSILSCRVTGPALGAPMMEERVEYGQTVTATIVDGAAEGHEGDRAA